MYDIYKMDYKEDKNFSDDLIKCDRSDYCNKVNNEKDDDDED